MVLKIAGEMNNCNKIILQVLQFLVLHLEMRQFCSVQMKSKISCIWTEGGRVRKLETLSLVRLSAFRGTALRIIVFNIPKEMSTRAYVIAWTQFYLHTDIKWDATLDAETIPGWNTYFYFTWTPNRTILNGLTDMGFCFGLFVLVYYTYSRENDFRCINKSQRRLE